MQTPRYRYAQTRWSADKAAVSEYLNRTWKEYGINWTVNVDNDFYVNAVSTDKNKILINNILDMGLGQADQFLSNYTTEQKVINRRYNTYAIGKKAYSDETMYVFILPSNKAPYPGQIGDMPLGKQWGYLFVNNFGSSHYRTLSHELGHGRTALHHTFEDGYLDKFDTQNLMDYVDPNSSPLGGGWEGATDLVRAQWDMAHNPAIFTPLQSDEDGAYYNIDDEDKLSKFLNIIACTNLSLDDFAVFKNDLRPTSNRYNTITFLYNGIIVAIKEINNIPPIGISLKLDLKNPIIRTNGIMKEVVYNNVNTPNSQFIFSVMANNFDNFFKIINGQDHNYINRLVASIPTEESQKAYSQIAQLPDCAYSLITIENRIKYLGWFAGELWLNQDQEDLVVLMIDKTLDDQIVPLIDFLKNNRIMLDLCYKIDNIGGNDNFTAFTNSLFKIYNKKYSAELDVNTFYLPKENLFIWMDKGFAEKITYQLDYKRDENEFSFRWKYRRDFSNPVKVAPFEVVAVNFQTDISFLPLPGNKKVVLMPAFVFAWLINEDNNVTTQAKIDLGKKVAELALAIYQIKTIDLATSAFMKAIYYINLARTGTNTLLLYEPLTDEIEAYEYGAQFLDAYYKINNVWEIGDFTVNWWLDGSIGYFTVFTQAWDKMVDDNEDTDFITKYPEFYNLVTKIKEGLE